MISPLRLGPSWKTSNMRREFRLNLWEPVSEPSTQSPLQHIRAKPHSRMHEVNLITLRRLRERARALLRSTLADLRPFAKADGTFRRKPDSPSIDDDVNVTTTCSCVMALAGTNSFHDFYKKQAANDADSIFKTMVDAPWMSSGLTANNAFTTALVIRTFGFLLEEDLFKKRSGDDGPIQSSAIKNWELHLGIKNVSPLRRRSRSALTSHLNFSGFRCLTRPVKT